MGALGHGVQGRREAVDHHAIGRSRGGLTCKTHLLVDGLGRPLVIAMTPGQAGDSPAMTRLLDELRVARPGQGRPRTTPVMLRADKTYSSRPHRALLRRRGIIAVSPEPADQQGHRLRRDSRGGRPPDFDPAAYRGRNVVERCFNRLKNWRALATRHDKHALVFRGQLVLAAILLWPQRP